MVASLSDESSSGSSASTSAWLVMVPEEAGVITVIVTFIDAPGARLPNPQVTVPNICEQIGMEGVEASNEALNGKSLVNIKLEAGAGPVLVIVRV